MEHYTLPDGREPLRFDSGRAAFYPRAHGEGEVRYTFSMIKWFQQHRPVKSHEELQRIARERARRLMASDPEYYRNIANKRHKKENTNGRQDRQDQKSQGEQG